MEIRTEEEFESDLIQVSQITETFDQLEKLYVTAETLKGNLDGVLEESRTTLDTILA